MSGIIIHAIACLMNWQKRKLVEGRQRKFVFQELEPRGSIIIWHPLNVVPDQNKKLTLVRNVGPESTLKTHPLLITSLSPPVVNPFCQWELNFKGLS